MVTLEQSWNLKEKFTIINLNNMDVKISEIEQVFKDVFEEEDGVVN